MTSVLYLLIALGAIHIIGVLCFIHAILWARSSQGAIAWAVSLLLLPYIAVPLYLILGRSQFKGYRETRDKFLKIESLEVDKLRSKFFEHGLSNAVQEIDILRDWEKIFKRPFIGANKVELLIDGEETFHAIEESIKRASKYILFQFYILRDDQLGKRLAESLISKAKQGVNVCVLYDEIGSASLSNSYLADLRGAGVNINSFNTRKGVFNKLQLNFRNHRKIVVVDGQDGFIGGHNVGVEYLGKDPKFGNWHDLHIKIDGPEVAALQATFLRDWYWATGQHLTVEWDYAKGPGDSYLMTIPTGPADELEQCSMMFLEAINSAKKRIWIASPYFVPDDSIMLALQLAASRGVDVRILLPERPDHIFVWLASFAYIPDLLKSGAKVFRYSKGFLHAKAFVVDDYLSMIGTPNLDNRSFRLNFEIATIIYDPIFSSELSKTFQEDFQSSLEEDLESAGKWSWSRRISSRIARLLSPIL